MATLCPARLSKPKTHLSWPELNGERPGRERGRWGSLPRGLRVVHNGGLCQKLMSRA
jgi:hypothetical protein